MNKQRSRTQNTILNLMSGFVGEIIIYGLNFVSRTVFIQTLGKEYLGIGGLFSNILSLLCLADLGIGTALNYRLYKPLKENNENRLHILMTFYKKVYRIIGLGILGLGICVIPFLQYVIKDFEKFARLGLSATLVFGLYLLQSVSTYWFFAYKSAIVKADQREYSLNLIGYIGAFLTAIVQIVVLVTTRNYMIYIASVILMNILQNYMYARIADKYYPFLKEKNLETLTKQEKKQIFKDCGAISIFEISSVVLKATDNLVLASFIGLDIVGLYSNYLMIYNALKKIIKRIVRSAQASLGNLFTSVSCEVQYDFFKMMNLTITLICGTAAVCVAVLSDEFITVWIGKEFVIAMPFSTLIGIELYTIGLKLHLEQIRNVLGLFQQMKIRPIISVVLNVIISVACVQNHGIYGVLIGTLISEWATTLVIDPYIIYKKGFKGYRSCLSYYLRNTIYVLELTFIGSVNWYFCNHVLLDRGWISFLVHSVVCVCSTIVFIIIINIKSREMRDLLARVQRVLCLVVSK